MQIPFRHAFALLGLAALLVLPTSAAFEQAKTFTTTSTGTLTGSFIFDTTDPSRPDYAGRFTEAFGDNSNSNSQLATSTFRVRGTGTDGSTVRFHTVAHTTADTIDASSDSPTVTGVRVNFDRLRCG